MSHWQRSILTGLSLGLGAMILSACSGDDDKDVFVSRDVEVLYNLGLDELKRERFTLAAAVFDEVERQHPYSAWARQSQLMSAYAYYEGNDYDEAILAAERFLSLHPGNASAPYAYYLIALCHFEQIGDVARDQRKAEQAYQALTEVVRRYPESEYARDATSKIQWVRDHLAGKEMEIGRFYLSRREFLAAILRFETVVNKFETTTHTPEALHRLVEAYTSLGLLNEARANAAVLGHNFPDTKWYRYSYALLEGGDIETEEEQGFFSRIF